MSNKINNGAKVDQYLKAYRRSQFFKTRPCPQFAENGKCRKGQACNYAHAEVELRPSVNLTNTKLCPGLSLGGCNKVAGTCQFAHTLVELRSTAGFYKTEICKFWWSGNCPSGIYCRHAHGELECRVSDLAESRRQSGLRSNTGQAGDTPFSMTPTSVDSPESLDADVDENVFGSQQSGNGIPPQLGHPNGFDADYLNPTEFNEYWSGPDFSYPYAPPSPHPLQVLTQMVNSGMYGALHAPPPSCSGAAPDFSDHYRTIYEGALQVTSAAAALSAREAAIREREKEIYGTGRQHLPYDLQNPAAPVLSSPSYNMFPSYPEMPAVSPMSFSSFPTIPPCIGLTPAGQTSPSPSTPLGQTPITGFMSALPALSPRPAPLPPAAARSSSSETTTKVDAVVDEGNKNGSSPPPQTSAAAPPPPPPGGKVNCPVLPTHSA